MRKFLLNIFVLLTLLFIHSVSTECMAQEKDPLHSFPKDFIGHWKGTLTWHPAGKEVQTVPMQLKIQTANQPSVYSWQIIYGNADEDNRPYLLKPVDSAAGHWMVDENNGILLDGYWIGNRFIDMFSVKGNTITSVHWLEGEALHIEMISTRTIATRESGKGTEEIPAVQSFPVRSYQKAILYKSR